MITPTQHEKNEWSRLAQAAYAIGSNTVGHRYSGAASIPTNARLSDAQFDELQTGYRSWLVDNVLPLI